MDTQPAVKTVAESGDQQSALLFVETSHSLTDQSAAQQAASALVELNPNEVLLVQFSLGIISEHEAPSSFTRTERHHAAAWCAEYKRVLVGRRQARMAKRILTALFVAAVSIGALSYFLMNRLWPE